MPLVTDETPRPILSDTSLQEPQPLGQRDPLMQSQALFQLGQMVKELPESPSRTSVPEPRDDPPPAPTRLPAKSGGLFGLSMSISALRRRKTTEMSLQLLNDGSGDADAGPGTRPHSPTSEPESPVHRAPGAFHPGSGSPVAPNSPKEEKRAKFAKPSPDELEALLSSYIDISVPVEPVHPEYLDYGVAPAATTEPELRPAHAELEQFERELQAAAARGEHVPSVPSAAKANHALVMARSPDLAAATGASPYLHPHHVPARLPIRESRPYGPADAAADPAAFEPVASTTSETLDLRLLRIKLYHIVFQSHPLLNAEQRLVDSLASAVALHTRLCAQQTDAYLTQRIRATIDGYKRGKRDLENEMANRPGVDSPLWQFPLAPPVASAQFAFMVHEDHAYLTRLLALVHSMQEGLAELRELRITRQRERGRLADVEHLVQRKWSELQQMRIQQGFASSTERLEMDSEDADGVALADLEEEARDLARENAEFASVCSTEAALCALVDPELVPPPCALPAYLPAETVHPTPGRTFRLAHGAPTTAPSGCPRSEQARRGQVEALAYAVRVQVGNTLVTSTRTHGMLDERRAVIINEAIDVFIDTSSSTELSLGIFEEGRFFSTFVSRVSVPKTYSSHAEGMHQLSWASSTGEYAGQLHYQLMWHSSPPGIAAAAEDPFPALSQLPNPARLDARWAISWASTLHAETPRDHPMVPQVQRLVQEARAIVVPHTHRELDAFADHLSTFSPVDARRHEILSKRHLRQIVGVGAVPLGTEVMALTYQDAQPPSKELQMLLQNKHELGAGKFAALARRLHIRQLHAKGALAREQQFEHLVREVRLPRQEERASFFAELLRPRRPLCPVKADQTWAPVVPLPDPHGEYSLIVQVKRGFNFPERAAAAGGSAAPVRDMDAALAATLATVPGLSLEPASRGAQLFVQVEFARQSARTGNASGPHPEWNTAVTIPTRIPSEDSIPNGMVHINIFDEVLVDMQVDDRLRDRAVHYVKEARWIGRIQVPFVVLCEQGKLAGRFPVAVPAPLLGYTRSAAAPANGAAAADGVVAQKGAAATMADGAAAPAEPLLELFLVLDPPFSVASQLHLHAVAPFEEESVHDHAARWQAVGAARFPHRFALCMATDLSGNLVHVARYLYPVAPPPFITRLEQAVRFVTLIPTLSDRLSFAADVQIWALCDQFLALGAGDGIDHAVLLANFLLYLGYEAYLVLGHGVPEGRTAHVLVLKHPPSRSPAGSQHDVAGDGRGEAKDAATASAPLFINPLTGRVRRLQDRSVATIGLTSVGCVVGPDNVWLNVQPVDDTADQTMSWDLSNVRAWTPFFALRRVGTGKGGSGAARPYPPSSMLRPEPWTTVQPAALGYTRVSTKSVRSLQQQVEAAVIRGIETWRRHPTRWNRLLCRVLQNAAATQEVDGDPDVATLEAAQLRRTAQATAMCELAKIAAMQGQQLYAISINLPWTDEDTLVDAVHATRVWDCEDSSVEYALGVHCTGLFNGIVSVWILLAATSRRWPTMSTSGIGTAGHSVSSRPSAMAPPIVATAIVSPPRQGMSVISGLDDAGPRSRPTSSSRPVTLDSDPKPSAPLPPPPKPQSPPLPTVATEDELPPLAIATGRRNPRTGSWASAGADGLAGGAAAELDVSGPRRRRASHARSPSADMARTRRPSNGQGDAGSGRITPTAKPLRPSRSSAVSFRDIPSSDDDSSDS
ncbi:hypothetical protein H9P43_001598 [Blastocladiella emersonii ATCC 22665]|nr:hypothetical protein H9P43_001598 [Blastocladiella emersonii ATCC 22665]